MTVGYFSLIQFCPDAGRLEAANVGLVLFAPESRYFEARTAKGVGRVHRFFGNEVIDAQQFDILRLSVETLLRQAREGVRDRKDMAELASTFANEMRVTPPRPVALDRPATVVFDEMFELLVGTPKARPRRTGVRERLAVEFDKPEYADRVTKQVEIDLPELGSHLTLPFGYQSGRFNLILPTVFHYETGSELVNKTGQVQLEAELIYRAKHPVFGPTQLVVVGEFPEDAHEGESDSTAERVEKLLTKRHAKFYRADRLPEFLSHIRTEAKPLARLEDRLFKNNN